METAIAGLVGQMSGTTVGTIIVAIFLIPPVIGLLAATKIAGAMNALREEFHRTNEENNKRFEVVVSTFRETITDLSNRYDNNVYLVKNWEKVAGDMATLVAMNSTASTRLADHIKQLIDVLNHTGKTNGI